MGAVRRALMSLVVLAGLVVVATGGAAADADPTRPGGLRVTSLEYDAGPAVVGVPPNGHPDPVQLHGQLYLPSGTGRLPVLLFLHGRHGSCGYAGVEFVGFPCPTTPATNPIDSYKGYAYLAQNLASHGYLVVSVDANGINSYDLANLDSGTSARAELISRTLDLLGTWNSGPGPGAVGSKLQGRVDLRRLGLMGHSRGGEGVTAWLAYNKNRTDGPRYNASAVFALAPTDFADHVVVDRTAYAVLLPRCDGDVSNLQGADVFERSQYRSRGPLHQITVEGANHNWFNSVWTFDDNEGTNDTVCGLPSKGSGRLTIAQQERVGLAWMAAFFRRYVGGDRAFDGMLSGRAKTTTHCARETRLPCAELVDLSYQPGPAARTTLLAPVRISNTDFRPGPGSTMSTTGAITVTGCDTAAPRCPPQGDGGQFSGNRSNGPQLTLSWDGPATLAVTTGGSWRGSRGGELVLRMGVNSTQQAQTIGTDKARLRVQVTDTHGGSASVRVTPAMGAPEPPPGSTIRNLVLADVRIALRAFEGVDVTSLRSVRLLLDDASGSVQLADVSLQAH
jgi:dienelactone hydrolase